MSDDAKEFTFKLREGVKWSDGKPITTEDFDFWYNICYKDDRIYPVRARGYQSGGKAYGELMRLEIIDKYTIKFISTEPYPGFLAEFTYNRFIPPYQAEFMKQFHIDYASEEELNEKCKKYGFLEGEWYKLLYSFSPESGTFFNNRLKAESKVPVFSPYLYIKVTDTEMFLERNPYYWKVDKEGNQLPYIDRIHVSIVNNVETPVLMIINGEVDLVRRCVAAANMPLYKENEEKGGYKTYLFKQHASLAEIFLNLNHDDLVWREVVNDLRFRKALSYATNRDRIIDLLYLGLAGKPSTIPINEYDPDKANKLLDEMGLDKKDSEGYRLGPDGKRFEIPFQVATFTGEEEKTIELLINMYKEIGIYTTMKKFDSALWLEMMASNSIKAFTWWAHYQRWPWHENYDYLGKAWQYTYCSKWYQWYESEGQMGEEPPAEYKELRELINKMYLSVDPQKQQEYWELAKKNITENIWWIPVVDDILGPLIVNKKIGNIPKAGYAIDIGASAVVQMYFKE
jgi:peptide/nickel transport system substrate-binding protein